MASYTTSFTVNQADLAFMLRQIQIAEATSIGYTEAPKPILQAIMESYGISAADAALAPFGLRTVDGTFNSLVPGQTNFGAADTLFPRLTNPVFRNDLDGDTMPLGPPGGPVVTNTNYDPRLSTNPAGVNPDSVADADPRIISNLIVDMSVNNPAAVEAWFNNPLSLEAFEEAYPGITPLRPGEIAVPGASQVVTNLDLATIPNLSPDIGLSPGFNSWMTFFGQFFDHGLDLVTKGNAGTVYIPLQPDDPLYEEGSPTNFMVLTRATTTLDANGVPQHENTTTSFVDQNQTYTSHSSHQVFLREYVKVDGQAVSTGRLLDGTTAGGSLDGAIGNWAEVKAQALDMLGIRLDDFDVHNVPLLLADQYGKFIPGPNGYAQMVMAPDGTHDTNWLQEGTAAGITTAGSIGTNHGFLNDLSHHAGPGYVDLDFNGTKEFKQLADSDPGEGDDDDASTYDDEMLDAHFITGDGRGNENIALTTVHSIFHSEHNRLVAANKSTILATGDRAFINEWLAVDLAAGDPIPADPAALTWDGERLFQAARFATEMQYQHMVFEEFARRVQPMVDPFVFNSSPNIDASIVAEFAHTVYRFGHSMLTGTVDRLDNNLETIGAPDEQSLLAVFLNPQIYLSSGTTLEEVNANLIRGLSRDVGNEMDEFIVSDVRSNLLGLPLDLAALNIARGRETGIPSLNETRAQLYNAGAIDLKPYTSWADFAQNIKNPASIVNFIAAYGTHATLIGLTATEDMRLAAQALVNLAIAGDADATDFINAQGIYAGGSLGGMNNIDLWIGGLAEQKNEFGGMLGQTFNYIFEYQMEQLQFGDRMYYLTRTQGMNFLNQLEPNTFSDIVMRNTELGNIYSTHLNGALFTTPDHILELDRGIAQDGADPTWAPGEPHSAFASKVTRTLSGVTVVDPVTGIIHDVGGTLKFLGGEHVVLGGTEGNDRLYGDKGIDTLWGDGGNDYLNAGMESDDVFGGDGDDIIEDPFGDDVLRGNAGNDVIAQARGADLMFGDEGNDFLMIGQDAAEAFGGTGDDFILGGDGKDFLLGNEGDDWIEGGSGFDTLAGENSELFFNSSIIGHDVLFNQGDEGDYDAESGDDIMGSGPSVFRYEGMFGFDWGIAKNDVTGVNFDLQIPIFTTIPADVLRDRFDQVEGLSGWKYDDRLDGDDRGHKGGGSSAPDSVPVELFTDHVLTQEGIERITGFEAWMGGARQTLFGLSVPGAAQTSYRDGNILMGGDGNDFLRGRGGYDLLDGDAWLNVRIKIVVPTGLNAGTYSAESLSSDRTVAGEYAGKVYNTLPDGSPNFSSVAFGGASLTSLMIAGTINPGALSIVREILTDTTPNNNTDTAIYQGTMAEYEIEGRTTDGINGTGVVITEAHDVNGDGFIFVRDRDTGAVGAVIEGPDGQPLQLPSSRGPLTDDRDLIKNIEQLQFADQTIVIAGSNRLPVGTVTIDDPTPFDGKVTPYVGQVLVPTLSGFSDADGIPLDPITGLPIGLTYEWQTTEFGNNSGWATITTGLTYTVRSVDPGHILRAVAVFKDGNGVTERLFSVPTDNPTPLFNVNENSPAGTVVGLQIPFNIDYDPEPIGGNPPADVDLTTLFHQIDPANSAGGRFTVELNGVDSNGFPRYSLKVASGAPALDYEAIQSPADNQYQVVINTYSDNPAAGGVLVAVRQFTILLNDVADGPSVPPVPPSGLPVIVDANGGTPTEGQLLTLNTTGITDSNGLGPFSYQWQASLNGITWTNILGATAASFTPDDNALQSFGDQAGRQLRAIVSYTDGLGVAETLTSAATGPVGVDWDGAAVSATFNGTAGDDIADGSVSASGGDILNGNGGNDILNGNAGNERLTGGAGNDTLNGGAGIDVAAFTGVIGNYSFATSGTDILVTANIGDEGTDTISGVETLRFNSLGAVNNYAVVMGSAGADINLNGAAGAGQSQAVFGLAGDDSLYGGAGNDMLHGGDGIDTLTGGAGADILTGGAGADTFDYDLVSQSGVTPTLRDVITDFLSGIDKLDFSTIDADTAVAGNQAFNFSAVLGEALSGAGQLRYHHEGAGADAITVIEGNTNANLAPDFQITLLGHQTLLATDLML